MAALEPIPTPLAARWREFRTRTLPFLGFGAIALAAGWLWIREGSATSFPALADGVRSVVTSAQPGTLQTLLVEPFQLVEAGSPVAILVPADPRGELSLWQTELDMARLKLQPSVAEENAVDLERLRLELLRTRAEMAATEVNLKLAENQVRRQTALHQQQLISDDLHDISVKARDSLSAKFQATSNAVNQIEAQVALLQALAPLALPDTAQATNDLLSDLDARHSTIATHWAPLTLRAPVSGMVTVVHRQAGEHIINGEPILTISSLRSERVVGYLRQPFPQVPQPGMTAILTTREWKRARYVGVVSQIGAQMEYITNSLALVRTGALVDTGLPVVIALPPHAQLRPGEVVDVQIQNSGIPQPMLGASDRVPAFTEPSL